MITRFGKFCRNIRMDRGEILKDMADKLEVKSSFLSAVELGKKNIPEKWLESITELYELTEDKRNELEEAIEKSAKSIKIDLVEKNESDRDIVFAFARSFDNLTEVDKKKLKKLLSGGNS